ncbi:DNA repair protein RecN, partial [Streptomyces sp. SID9913]|nr:DNA repair protein RecN [Streptomyces sp. SID9913]
ALAALTDRIGEIGILLRDVAGELAGYADDLEADPLRLAAVEERRAALTGLTRKYGEDVGAVLTWAEQAAARLTELDGDDERIGELTAERDALRAELGELARTLSEARAEAAERFAAAVTAE